MPEFNLLGTPQGLRRDVSSRLQNKAHNRAVALEFGAAYFDGPRSQGYGGYHYDGRWQPVSRRAAQRYSLQAHHRVLDIGCAKGFFVQDLQSEVPGLQVFGLDISHYALSQAHEHCRSQLIEATADQLPLADQSVDAVFAINTLHNLPREACIAALKEINRVCRDPKRCFVQVDAYRNPHERRLFEDWMLTAKTWLQPQEWQDLFAEAGYQGDWFWTIIEFDHQYDTV